MTYKEAAHFVPNRKIITTISVSILTIFLLCITTVTTGLVNNVNIALAQSQFGSSISTISLTEGNNNNNNNNITSQQPQKIHEYTLIAEDTTIEIAPGLRVDAWTYNGTVPGPTLTATEGDRVIIHFINKTPLPHTVHLHGDHPSEQDGVFEQIPANGTYTYDIIAKPAGALAYHCHVPPVMQHVRMGLYGAFIVYPKTPLPPAREYVLVDGEYRYSKSIKSNTRILHVQWLYRTI